MILNPSAPFRFEIAGPDGDAVFLLKMPTRAERIALDAEIAARGGRNYGTLDLVRRARAEILRPFKGKDVYGEAANFVAALTAVEEMMLDGVRHALDHGQKKEPTDADNRALIDMHEAINDQMAELAPVFDLIADGSPVFRQMRRDAAAYPVIRRVELLRAFVMGGENIGFPIERGARGLTDESLDKLTASRFGVIVAAKLEAMLSPDMAARKNSPSPSPIGGGKTISATSGTRRRTTRSKGTASASPGSTSTG